MKLFWLVTAIILVISIPLAEAQQPGKIPRVGFLSTAGGSGSEALRQALRHRGYIEGKNVAFEFRGPGGNDERRAYFANELVRLKVDVIVAGGSTSIKAAKDATSTIPIVMSGVNDPIALGFVANLSHPGGNITGVSNLAPELCGKRLELLKEVSRRLLAWRFLLIAA